MVPKTNNKNYYIINFIAHVVVTCYGTIWQKVLLQFTSCVNWSEHYSNPSTPPLREAIASYEAALDDLQCKQAEVGGLKEKLAAATSPSWKAQELTTSVVWATKSMAYKQSTWPNLTVCTRFNIKIRIDAGRPRGAWAYRRSWLTCMASSMNKNKAMTRPNANCYEIKQPNNSTCILVNQKKGETYHVFWIKDIPDQSPP